MSEYVEFDNVRMGRVLPSGKAFVVVCRGGDLIVPIFAVHANSEIWKGSDEGDEGVLKLREDIAIQKGLADPPSRSLGGGIPLKRNRLPEPVVLMSEERLAGIIERLDASSFGDLLVSRQEEVHGEHGLLAVFDTPADAEFVAATPRDIDALFDENRRLRDWVAKVTKRRTRR